MLLKVIEFIILFVPLFMNPFLAIILYNSTSGVCYDQPPTTYVALHMFNNRPNCYSAMPFEVCWVLHGNTLATNPFAKEFISGYLASVSSHNCSAPDTDNMPPSKRFILVLSEFCLLEANVWKSIPKHRVQAMVILSEKDSWNDMEVDFQFSDQKIPFTVLSKDEASRLLAILRPSAVAGATIAGSPRTRNISCSRIQVTIVFLVTVVTCSTISLFSVHSVFKTDKAERICLWIKSWGSKRVLARMPIRRVQSSNGSVCAICREDIVTGDIVRSLERCKHEFHASCLDPWIRGDFTRGCPLCRRKYC